MKHIQRVSCLMQIAFNIVFIYLVSFTFIEWLCSGIEPFKTLALKDALFSSIQTPEGLVKVASLSLSLFARGVGFLGGLTQQLPTLVGLVLLKRLFHNYQLNQIFTSGNVRTYKYLGILLFLEALIAKPLGGTLTTFAVTWGNAPGHRYITLGFGTPNVGDLLMGMLVIVISWVMAEGLRLREEETLTI
jgi:hypothetical protein